MFGPGAGGKGVRMARIMVTGVHNGGSPVRENYQNLRSMLGTVPRQPKV